MISGAKCGSLRYEADRQIEASDAPEASDALEARHTQGADRRGLQIDRATSPAGSDASRE
jgi:hypothetical protein